MTKKLLAGLVLLACSVPQIYAQAKRTPPTPAQMLDPRLAPKHDDVVVSMPTPDELAACTVASVQGATKGASGWVLFDGKKQPLRRFYDSNGDDKVDVWSYYKDGVEVYREFDTTYKGAPNNFRWLNAGGMKWGVGSIVNGKAVITAWRMISAEEVGFEAYQATATNDFARLQTLFISEGDMKLIKLPTAKATGILSAQQKAKEKFDALTKAIDLSKAKFEAVEGSVPQCDTTTETECIKYASRPIRYEQGPKDYKWLHTGEMIQVGMAWRLVNVPSNVDPVGMPVVNPGNGGGKDPLVTPELQKLLIQLAELDKDQPNLGPPLSNDKKVDTYMRTRIPLVYKIIQLDEKDKREGWYKQIFDNHTALAQNSGEAAAFAGLKKMSDDVASKMPSSNLAAYGHYRVIWTRYAIDMAQPNLPIAQITKIQDKWLENLVEYVKLYPKAEDTPEALRHLGNGSEFSGKDEEAKRWYTQLFDNFPKHALAEHAKGCVARLNLTGNEMKLTAPLLSDSSKLFDIASLKGKVVVVYYWASYGDQYQDDFAKMNRILTAAAKQNVELVAINLDPDAARAKAAVAKANAPGTHLFQAPPNNASGVSSSPLATQYGIHILPTVFMIDRNGRVSNRSLQVGDIETELKKVQ
ncbi:MAG TPA: thioredoxin-like domain-containing protein [Gemmataceae bacterium]|nr:thioredoxin-like domain-containing protein [Gemmataceae bacterium]